MSGHRERVADVQAPQRGAHAVEHRRRQICGGHGADRHDGRGPAQTLQNGVTSAHKAIAMDVSTTGAAAAKSAAIPHADGAQRTHFAFEDALLDLAPMRVGALPRVCRAGLQQDSEGDQSGHRCDSPPSHALRPLTPSVRRLMSVCSSKATKLRELRSWTFPD